MNESEIKYLIALTQVEGVGPIIAKELLEFFGSAEALFKEDPTSPLLPRIKTFT